jgi:hypothetical protein
MHKGEENTYGDFMGKSEENGPVGRSRCSWKDNIKMDLREI